MGRGVPLLNNVSVHTSVHGCEGGRVRGWEGECQAKGQLTHSAVHPDARICPPSPQMGHTKVFFRAGVLGFVEDRWARMQSSALKIQVCVGGGY